MNKLLFLLAGLLPVCWSCGRDPQVTPDLENAVEIYVDKVSERSLREMIVRIEPLKLQAGMENKFAGVSKVLFLDDRLYVLDRNRQAIFIFGENGELLCRVDRTGRGPGEYIRIGSFALDYKNKKMVVADDYSRKILILDEWGEFEREIRTDTHRYSVLPFGERGFIHINDGSENALPVAERTFNLSVLDSQANFTKGLLRDMTPLPLDVVNYSNTACLSDGSLLYSPFLSDRIYEVSEPDGISCRYYFTYDLPGYQQLINPDRHRARYEPQETSSNLVTDYENGSYICSLGDFFETDSVLLARAGIFRNYYTIYDKRSEKSVFMDCTIPNPWNSVTASAEEVENVLLSGPLLQVRGAVLYIYLEAMDAVMLTSRLPEGVLKDICNSLTEQDWGCLLKCELGKI